MQTIRSIVAMNSFEIPPRLKRVLTRLGSLLVLVQRMPVVQMLFPEANVLGGASLANSVSLAVTTVVGLGAYDSVAGATTIVQDSPVASSTLKDVPAAVGSNLNFVFRCVSPPSDPEAWSTTALPTNLTLTNTYPPNPATDYSDSITGIPTTPGKFPVTITVWRYPEMTGEDKKSQVFNIYVMGFSTQPAASTTINSGSTTTLNCAYLPAGKPTAATVTYEWYQGTSGTIGTVLGTAASYTTPNNLSGSNNYWVRIKSVFSGSTVYVNSNTAVVNVTPPPSVTVAVAPASVTEDGASNLVYTFSRTGATTAALTATFSVGGTATFGADYVQTGAGTFTTTTGTVTIPAGSASTAVVLDPTADSTVEVDETAIITVTNGAGYTAGVPAAATGTITNDDTAYSSWASALPVGQRGPTQTPQNDGITNEMKFACNLNPLAPDVRKLTVGGNQLAGLPGQAVVAGKLRLEFLRRKASTNPGITYTAQFGSDLAGWADIPTGTPAGTSIDATWERVTVDDPSPGATRFARLKVIQAP